MKRLVVTLLVVLIGVALPSYAEDAVVSEAKEQEMVFKVAHDEMKKTRLAKAGRGDALADMLVTPIEKLAGSNDQSSLQNWGNVCLDHLYDGNKEEAIRIADLLDGAATKSFPKSQTSVGQVLYYFAIGCYMEGDLKNAEKYGLKSIEKYVAAGSKLRVDQSNLQLCYYMLAVLYDKQGNNEKALEYAKKGQEVVR
ncbi:MAG: tetratricopeptide repeat protein [Candidatus Melainabacteria bacterium]|nr:tetratricopeptide repeat protein [Candidatus Melainabacteria bacterium]